MAAPIDGTASPGKETIFMQLFFDGIKRIIEAVGKVGSYLILFIMAIVTYEVISRYAFNAPTSWAWLINKQIFGVFVLVAGGYTLIHKSHIRIEMLYDHYPPALKTAVRWLTLAAAFCFLGSLFWKSGVMGLDAWQNGETATGVLKLPLYPLKMFMPVGAGLFLLGCVAIYAKKK
jgi:TRAP-type mannitol/chloroaromatic compound transport system permease small subunit